MEKPKLPENKNENGFSQLMNLLDWINPKDLKKFFANWEDKEIKKFFDNLLSKLWIEDEKFSEIIINWFEEHYDNEYYINIIIEVIEFIEQNKEINFDSYLKEFIEKHDEKNEYKSENISWIEIILWFMKSFKENQSFKYKTIDDTIKNHIMYEKFFNYEEINNSNKLEFVENHSFQDEQIRSFNNFINSKLLKILNREGNGAFWFRHFFGNRSASFIVWELWSINNLGNLINFIEKGKDLNEFIEIVDKLEWIMTEKIKYEWRQEDLKILWEGGLGVLVWVIYSIKKRNELWIIKNENDFIQSIIENISHEQRYLKILNWTEPTNPLKPEEKKEQKIDEKFISELELDKISNVIKFFGYIKYKYDIYGSKEWFRHYFLNWININTITPEKMKNIKKIMTFWDKWERIEKLIIFAEIYQYINNNDRPLENFEELLDSWKVNIRKAIINEKENITKKEAETRLKDINKIKKELKVQQLSNWLETISSIIDFIESWNEEFDYHKIKENIEKYINLTK